MLAVSFFTPEFFFAEDVIEFASKLETLQNNTFRVSF